jgi:hypothetical protein
LLGRKVEVVGERSALLDAFVEALEAYRCEASERVFTGFESYLAIATCDMPDKVFLRGIAHPMPPSADSSGIWSSAENSVAHDYRTCRSVLDV